MGTEINSFIEKFKDYADCYTVIGGTACDILMTEAGTDFRATKDIDMILIMEARYKEFAHIFWEFIREGGIALAGKTVKRHISTDLLNRASVTLL